jgi:hypothetical protein
MNINFITLDSRKSTGGFFSYWFKPKGKEVKGSQDIELTTKLNIY